MNGKKGLCCLLIICLLGGVTLPVASIDRKSKGKLVLVGILSGLGYLTHTLVTRDTRATATLKARLGPPERIIQFERGFDQWQVNYYRQQYYIFRNNRFHIQHTARFSMARTYQVSRTDIDRTTYRYARFRDAQVVATLPFASTANPVKSVVFYPYLLEGERSLHLLHRPPRLR